MIKKVAKPNSKQDEEYGDVPEHILYGNISLGKLNWCSKSEQLKRYKSSRMAGNWVEIHLLIKIG